MMDTMLQQLLSKDVLYRRGRSRQCTPPWIKKNKKRLPDEEIVRRGAGLAKVRSIVEEFEKPEGETQFQTVVTLLQEMQAEGQRPEEIMKGFRRRRAREAGSAVDAGPG